MIQRDMSMTYNEPNFQHAGTPIQKTIEDDGSATPFVRTHVIPVPLLLDRPTLRADLVCGGQTRSVYNTWLETDPIGTNPIGKPYELIGFWAPGPPTL